MSRFFSMPELAALSPEQVSMLRREPAHVESVPGQATFLPAAMQFQLDYLASEGTPMLPRPTLAVTLYPETAQYAAVLGLSYSGSEYNTRHDNPISSPLMARSMALAVLSLIGIELPLVPDDDTLLRPVAPAQGTEYANLSLAVSPNDNALSEGEDAVQVVQVDQAVTELAQDDAVQVLAPALATVNLPDGTGGEMAAKINTLTLIHTTLTGQVFDTEWDMVGTLTKEAVQAHAEKVFSTPGTVRVYDRAALTEARATPGLPLPAAFLTVQIHPVPDKQASVVSSVTTI